MPSALRRLTLAARVAACLLPIAISTVLTTALLANQAAAASPGDVPTVHGLALYGDPQLPEDFAHFP
ncbi:MAG: hypothetical protein LC652_13060, partial [Halomonas sp.]|nr:hypothetical protein [Halomonas sp.]